MATTAYLNIGSNKGDRNALIGQAVALISRTWPQARVRLSDWVESEPWGFTSPHPFLNLGVALDFPDRGLVESADATVTALLAFLDTLQQIERRVCGDAHRNTDGSYRDRGIDIDIIAVDCLRVSHPRLQLPHPRAALRDFVMQPLRQLAPDRVVRTVQAAQEDKSQRHTKHP